MHSRTLRTAAAAAVLTTFLALGCGERAPGDTATRSTPAAAPVVQPVAEPLAEPAAHQAPAPPVDSRPARISGRVVFVGTAEAAPRIDLSSCAYFAAENPEGVLDPRYLVNADGTLPNVILWLDHAPVDVAERPVPAEPVEIVMDARARYRPHVLPMRDGQTLRLRAEAHDTMRPRIRPRLDGDTDRTLHSGQSADVVVPARDTPYVVTDEEHAWMSAYVRVFRHPWYAATEATGTFAIEDVPPGEHTLRAWHEKYGQVAIPLTLAPGSTFDVRVTLSGR